MKIFCKKCGKELVLTNKFCNNCGDKISDEDKFCFKCGKGYNNSDEFCEDCGKSLIKKKEIKSKIERERKKVGEEEKRNIKLEKERLEKERRQEEEKREIRKKKFKKFWKQYKILIIIAVITVIVVFLYIGDSIGKIDIKPISCREHFEIMPLLECNTKDCREQGGCDKMCERFINDSSVHVGEIDIVRTGFLRTGYACKCGYFVPSTC